MDIGRNLFKLLVFCLLVVGSVGHAEGQDSTRVVGVSNCTTSGYLKDMETVVLPTNGSVARAINLLHHRINLKWSLSGDFTIGLEERNRLYTGRLNNFSPQFNSFIAFDNGMINLSGNLIQNSLMILNVSVDRLWLDYTHNNFQVTFGRQRINWSQTFVWNPNDIFNTYSYFDFDYEEKPGSDALRLQYYTGSSSKAELVVKADRNRRITTAGLYRFNRWQYDFQGLFGMYEQEDFVLGLGWAGQIAKGGFKGEITRYIPIKTSADKKAVLLASVEYDYTFRNSLFLQVEGFYNSNASTDTNLLLSTLVPGMLNTRNPFLSGWSFFENLARPITPLIHISLASIYNPNYQMLFLIPAATFSLLENLDLSVVGQTFNSIGSSWPDVNQNSVFVRLKFSF